MKEDLGPLFWLHQLNGEATDAGVIVGVTKGSMQVDPPKVEVACPPPHVGE